MPASTTDSLRTKRGRQQCNSREQKDSGRHGCFIGSTNSFCRNCASRIGKRAGHAQTSSSWPMDWPHHCSYDSDAGSSIANPRRSDTPTRSKSPESMWRRTAWMTPQRSQFNCPQLRSVGPLSISKKIRSETSVATPMRLNVFGAVASRSGPRFREMCIEPISLSRAGRCIRRALRGEEVILIRVGCTPLECRHPLRDPARKN